MNQLDEKITFCTKCFATNENGSWGTNGGWSIQDVKLKGLNCYCINCAGHGEIIVISRRAANTIRESASWVGKRYYPNKEDFLHSLIVNDDKGTYTVKWRFESGIKVAPEGVRALSGVSKNDAMKILSKALRLMENVENSHFD
ncbi:hypothetical protein [Brevibacillus laterosporus]|uniref:Uncharacterized protein n=1 Tax=Brevibacillus laterosporus TaxID=1465 RepID=A0AAP8QHP2_BRELA|nr:hypothetical protein [Brevibacillus laterosporus]PPB12921.1 hypothetical protein C4A77_00615 [Brevibacillus laterosporus]